MPLERLQKIVARAGLASRRGAEELITSGRVRVNGRVVTELGTQADTRDDKVEVDGRRIVSEDPVYLLLHKPRGVVSTRHDPEGRPTVTEMVSSIDANLYPIGRLDFHTSGALLLTNDGDFTQGLLHPRQQVPKVYAVKVQGEMNERDLDLWRNGMQLEDGMTAPCEVSLIRLENGKTWIEVTLFEGRNQQIRRMGEFTGFPVMRLARLSFAGIDTDRLRPGQFRALTPDELRDIKSRYGVPKRIPKGAPVIEKRPPWRAPRSANEDDDFDDIPTRHALPAPRVRGEAGGSGERRRGGPGDRPRRSPGEGDRATGERGASRPRTGPADDREASGPRAATGERGAFVPGGRPVRSRGAADERRSSRPRGADAERPARPRGAQSDERPAAPRGAQSDERPDRPRGASTADRRRPGGKSVGERSGWGASEQGSDERESGSRGERGAAPRGAGGRGAGTHASGGRGAGTHAGGGRGASNTGPKERGASERPSGGRGAAERGAGGRGASERPVGGKGGERPSGGRNAGERPSGGKGAGERGAGGRGAGDRATGGRGVSERPGGRSAGERPSGGRSASSEGAGAPRPRAPGGRPGGKGPGERPAGGKGGGKGGKGGRKTRSRQ